MREVGYSAATAICPNKNLTSKVGWDILKRELDADGAKQALNELVAPQNENKNVRLAAAIEIIKIQGGYPAQENKVIGLFDKISELKKNDRPDTTPTENPIPATSGPTRSPELPE